MPYLVCFEVSSRTFLVALYSSRRIEDAFFFGASPPKLEHLQSGDLSTVPIIILQVIPHRNTQPATRPTIQPQNSILPLLSLRPNPTRRFRFFIVFFTLPYCTIQVQCSGREKSIPARCSYRRIEVASFLVCFTIVSYQNGNDFKQGF